MKGGKNEKKFYEERKNVFVEGSIFVFYKVVGFLNNIFFDE